MNPKNSNILIIDADLVHAAALREALVSTKGNPPNFEWVRTLSMGLDRLRDKGVKSIWAIFLNLCLPDSCGLDTFNKLMSVDSTIPIVVLGGADDESTCEAAMLRGAQDYLLEGHLDRYAFVRAIRNILEREVARRELFVERERALVTLNSIGDAVLSTDILGNVTYLNAVAEQMTGWIQKEALGRPLHKVFRIIDGVTRKPSTDPLELAIQQNKSVGLAANCVLIRRDGYEAAIEDSAAPIHDRDGQVTGAVIVFHDVSVSRMMVLEMSHRAQHDGLTDLPNRLLLTDRLTQSISMARRNRSQVAVLFLDLDGFKNVNDSLGHTIGDQLLQSVAARLSSCIRKSDTVSRQGGDEFVILLSEVAHAADAAMIAAKILIEVEKEHSLGELRLHVTTSIGVSTYPDSGEDAETLIKNADTAMYHAKESGRNNFRFFQRDMNLRAVERQSLEGPLRHALERSELMLHYQPKVDLKTGAITGVEALVRWQNPELGLVPPAQFLPIAENSGQIKAIGHWVLREACRQTRAWLDAGMAAVPIAVNVSSIEFQSDTFFEGVRGALKNSRLDPRYLELELTETVLMRHARSAADAIDRLKSFGVRVVVDDFGTGYSSLSYLTRFPIHALKLDQSFVRDIMTKETNAIVARAVISMGNNLQLKVIAEGLETAEQLAFLQNHGCDEGQGYYFSRPVAPDQFAKLLAGGMGRARTTNTASDQVYRCPEPPLV
jgi:diguanylate cyclase (GGDEF)-like protein/PAS domain S-box-containing protein